MYVVVNRCFGGYSLSEDFCKNYGHYENRTNKEFIRELCEYGFKKASGGFADIAIAEISDDISDYEIIDYDGIESIIYVTNGKISHDVKYIKNEQDVVLSE